VTDSAVQQLLDRARGPLGPNLDIDFGMASGPFSELRDLLSAMNGLFAFNAGVQVFHAGAAGVGPELVAWNEADTWKNTYGGLADDIFCFGQDILGTQFAISPDGCVVTFDPETARVTPVGDSVEAWAQWLFDDSAVHATAGLARAWQDANGPLGPDERLVPLQFLVAGGRPELDNLVVRDAATAMRVRGPIAQQLQGLPDGVRIHLSVE
jgi:hypothetical protein